MASDGEESAAETGDEESQDDEPTAPKKSASLLLSHYGNVDACFTVVSLFEFRRRSRRIEDDDDADASDQAMTTDDVTAPEVEKSVEVSADRCVHSCFHVAL